MPDATVVDQEPNQATAVGAGSADQAAGGTQPQPVEVPEFLKGQVDEVAFAKLPAEQQKTLVEIGRRMHGDYTRKTQEVADLRRIQEDLNSDPEKASHLKRALAEYEARKAGVPLAKPASDSAQSRLEAIMESATSEQREAIRALTDAYDERYQGDLKVKAEKIAALEQQVKHLLSDTQVSRQEQLQTDLTNLSPAYKTLGQQYREQILRMGTAPGGKTLTVQKMLQVLATPEEYTQAVLASQSDQQKQRVERTRQTATSKPSGAVGVTELGSEQDKLPSRDAKRHGPTWKYGSIIGKMLGEIRRGMPSA